MASGQKKNIWVAKSAKLSESDAVGLVFWELHGTMPGNSEPSGQLGGHEIQVGTRTGGTRLDIYV
jgi:hypothetical protein